MYIYPYIHLYNCIYTPIPKMCVCVFTEETHSFLKAYTEDIKMILAEEKGQWKFRRNVHEFPLLHLCDFAPFCINFKYLIQQHRYKIVVHIFTVVV